MRLPMESMHHLTPVYRQTLVLISGTAGLLSAADDAHVFSTVVVVAGAETVRVEGVLLALEDPVTSSLEDEAALLC